jgi:hypothetical protein
MSGRPAHQPISLHIQDLSAVALAKVDGMTVDMSMVRSRRITAGRTFRQALASPLLGGNLHEPFATYFLSRTFAGTSVKNLREELS